MIKKIELTNKGTVYNFPLILFSVAYYCIIIILAYYINIWEDEVYSLNTSSRGLSYAFYQSLNFELQPPVYFLFLTIWRIFSDSVLWARLFSVVLIFISQIYLYKFAKDVSNKKIASVTTVLFLLNPAVVYAILEIRTFPLVILLSLLILIVFYYTYHKNNITPWRRIMFIILSIMGLFTQYFIGFMLFGIAIALLIERNWRSLKLYIIDMIIPLCLLLILIPQVISSSQVQADAFPTYTRSLNNLFLEVRQLLYQVTIHYFFPLDLLVPGIWRWICRILLVILVFASINYTDVKKGLRELLPFLLITLVILLFFNIVLYMFGKYSVEYKYTLVLFISLSITLIFLLKLIRSKFLIYWFIILSITYLTMDLNKHKDLYKVKDIRSLSNYIEMVEKDQEPVFVYRNITSENLSYYYNGINSIFPFPKAYAHQENFGPEQWEISTVDLENLKLKLMGYSSFYFVIDNSPLRGVEVSKAYLLDFLFSNFTKEEEKSFKGELVLYKFSKKQHELRMPQYL
jgi:uncharacterized membrane protein